MMTLVTSGMVLALTTVVGGQSTLEYGADISLPMQHSSASTNYDWLPHNVDPTIETPEEYQGMPLQPLGDRQQFYKEYIQGCVEKFGVCCEEYETERFDMSLRQPQSMQNYTELGFKKIKTPPHLWEMITTFWENNKDFQEPEDWNACNSYVNHWASETRMVNVENQHLRGGGLRLRQELWDATRKTIEEWTGQELNEASLYGIRIYTRGSVLATHVDRMPLVSSAIINVASDLDEPWPLEVIAHDGKAHNVTMEPGDLVLYESHSVLHGRPFPLNGEFVANIFVHFEPTGHTLRHTGVLSDEEKERDLSFQGGGHESESDGLPPYLIPGSPAEDLWRMEQNRVDDEFADPDDVGTGSTEAHAAAKMGLLSSLQTALEADPDLIFTEDSNGWLPMHEAARGGHLDLVKYLHEQGADLSSRTNSGATPLYFAKAEHGEDHPVTRYLEEHGAEYEEEYEPEL